MLGLIILAIIVLIVVFFIATYNKLVTLQNRVKNGLSQIDVQLKQRFDLVPNLVETVKGYATHERGTLEQIVELRNSYQPSQSIETKAAQANELSQTLGRLFALQENYPELKANENFKELQLQLQKLEDQIRFSRQFYNDTVQIFNDKLLVFPNNILGKLLGFTEKTYFQATSEESMNPTVNF